METLSISDAFQNGLMVMLVASMPILLVTMGIGLLVGILQTATSIHEQTLSFIPKILAVFATLAIIGSWMFRLVGDMATNLFAGLYKYVG